MYTCTCPIKYMFCSVLLTVYPIDILMHQQQTAFENIVGKGYIAHNETNIFHNVSTMFSTQIIVSLLVHIFDSISLFAAEFEEPKIGVSGKGLNLSILTCAFEGILANNNEL